MLDVTCRVSSDQNSMKEPILKSASSHQPVSLSSDRSLTEFLDHPSVEELTDRLNLALEGAHLGIWDWDLRDNSVHFDRRWCQMVGLRFEDTPQVLTTWESRVHPDDLPKCYQAIEKYLKGESPYYESVHRMLHTDGHWVYILDRGRISGWDTQGKPIRFTGTHFDVTSVEQTRLLLEQERDLFRNLVAGLPHAVAMLSPQLTYLAVSEGWLNGSGFGVSDLVGKSIFESRGRFSLLQLSEDWMGLFHRVLGGESFSRERATLEDIEGASRSLRWWLRPWRKAGGGVGGVLVLVEDITEVVQNEIRLQLSAKMASLGEMAGSIAHEINTPLAIISLLSGQMSDLLADLRSSGQLKSESSEYLQLLDHAVTIDSTIQRISKIIRSMRAFARDTSAEPYSQVSLKTVLEDSLSLCTERFRHSGVRLLIEPFQEDPEILCRPSEIAQVFLNLLNNAWDAVNALPMSDQENRWIRVRYIPDDLDPHLVRVAIEDGGVPLTDDTKKRLFQPFFTTKPIGQGTGLGLALSLRIAQSHGGSVYLDEKSPQKRFVVELPRSHIKSGA